MADATPRAKARYLRPPAPSLKQRVYEALGEELLYQLERHHEVDPGLLAQFDLLSHSVKGDAK